MTSSPVDYSAGPGFSLLAAFGSLFVIAAVIWSLIALGAAAVAEHKGRSGLGWLLVGLIVGPLALLGAAIIEPRWPSARQRRRGEYRTCHACAEEVRPEAIKCRYCGTDFS